MCINFGKNLKKFWENFQNFYSNFEKFYVAQLKLFTEFYRNFGINFKNISGIYILINVKAFSVNLNEISELFKWFYIIENNNRKYSLK